MVHVHTLRAALQDGPLTGSRLPAGWSRPPRVYEACNEGELCSRRSAERACCPFIFFSTNSDVRASERQPSENSRSDARQPARLPANVAIAWMPVPTLESLCLDAVAANLQRYEPSALYLPCGGGLCVIDRLARNGRLRPETLGPLLTSDWASVAELEDTLGTSLVAAAPGCRGLSQLAAQRLHFRSRQPAVGSRERKQSMPDGTLGGSASTSAAVLEAR